MRAVSSAGEAPVTTTERDGPEAGPAARAGDPANSIVAEPAAASAAVTAAQARVLAFRVVGVGLGAVLGAAMRSPSCGPARRIAGRLVLVRRHRREKGVVRRPIWVTSRPDPRSAPRGQQKAAADGSAQGGLAEPSPAARPPPSRGRSHDTPGSRKPI